MFKTPFNWFNKFGTLPETYKEAMSYEEQIMWLCKEIKDNETFIEEFREEFGEVDEALLHLQEQIDGNHGDILNLETNKQDTLTAGNGILIQNDTISTAPTYLNFLLQNGALNFNNVNIGDVFDLTPLATANCNYLILDVNQGQKIEIIGKFDTALLNSNNEVTAIQKDVEASSFDNPFRWEILSKYKMVITWYDTNTYVPDIRLFMSTDFIYDEFNRKQNKLTAGSGISINNDVISATGNSDTYLNISSLIKTGSYIDLSNKSVGDTVNLTPITATNTSYFMKEVVHDEQFKITGDVIVAEIDSENKIVNITSGTGTTENPAIYTCIAQLPSKARIIVSFDNTNSNTPSIYDNIDNYYTFNNIESSKMIRKLKQDLYLEASNPNIPLINGLYYSDEYHVYVNGTINNDFNESIFYVNSNVIYLICSSGSFHKGNLHQEYWYNTSSNQWQLGYMNAITSWSEVNNKPSINNLSENLYLTDGTSSTGLNDGLYYTSSYHVYINNNIYSQFDEALVLIDGSSLYVIASPYNNHQNLGYFQVYYNSSTNTWLNGYMGMTTDWSLVGNKPTIATTISSTSTNDEIAGAKAVYDSLPTIATSISSSSTNTEVAGAKAVYDSIQPQDTGWIDISSYLNTTYFAARDNVAPKIRRIGNLIYFIGEIYCRSSVNNNQAVLFSNLPTYVRPPDQYTKSGVRFKSSPFVIFASRSGAIEVAESSSITTQNSYQGYTLSNLDGMLVDSDFPTNI